MDLTEQSANILLWISLKAPILWLVTEQTQDLDVVWRAVGDLHGRASNPRTHSDRQIAQLMRSIEAFGWTNPILIDEADGVLAGHGRLEAARRLGLTAVPTIRLDHLSEAQKRAYVIADNKLAENAGWDAELLAIELGALAEVAIDFDVTITGFETPEIDVLLSPPTDHAAEPAIPAMADTPQRVRLGDVWRLGDHVLVCGDAREPASYDGALGENAAALLLTDPPYNVPIAGHVSTSRNRNTRPDFAMATGEMTSPAFQEFLERFMTLSAERLVDGGLAYVFMDWRHLREALAAGEAVFDGLENLCVWGKTNAGMGSFYRSQHEEVLVFRKSPAKRRNHVALGRWGRNRSNLWIHPGASSFSASRAQDLADHPTVKPVALLADAICDASDRGDWVLDPFAGSGSTVLAAERVGRRAAVIEREPRYGDVILRRWEDAGGAAPERIGRVDTTAKDPTLEIAHA